MDWMTGEYISIISVETKLPFKMNKVIFLTFLVALMLPNCFGLDGLGMFARRFKSCDTSGDKALSWTEIQACSVIN